jgi:hypothetical protein
MQLALSGTLPAPAALCKKPHEFIRSIGLSRIGSHGYFNNPGALTSLKIIKLLQQCLSVYSEYKKKRGV